MKTRSSGKLLAVFLVVLTVVFSSVTQASADVTEYQLGQDSLVNAGKDNGYSKSDVVDKNDVHWGWQLGNFYVRDFTRVTEADDGTTVFLKNVGDEIALWFELEQDIDRLNDDDQLSVAEDKNGWDQRFQVPQQDFGRGMLIVKHTDYTNDSRTTSYSDFLAARASKKAATKVDVFEEGDYEVALDYEIQKPRVNVFGWKPAEKYFDYQTTFKFSVRNGNSMVFPFDVKTGDELTNAAATANGFRLDLAKSRYLDIDIKREVLNSSSDRLEVDTRSNRPAKDGDEYTEEGIYTITTSNRYTDQETVKRIYVGDNEVLKANAATGVSIIEINKMLSEGATIAEDGSIVPVDGQTINAKYGDNTELEGDNVGPGVDGTPSMDDPGGALAEANASSINTKVIVSAVGFTCVVLVLAVVAALWAKRKRSTRSTIPVAESDES